MKPVFLIGYMGSGKTTLGKAVSKKTGMRFVDLDEYIEAGKSMSVKEIFEKEGEDGFRRAERDALHRLGGCGDMLIACGGGTPCFFDNIDYMNRVGVTVYLDASHEALLRRLSAMRSHRPLIASLDDEALTDYIRSSIEKRMPFYSKAAHRFPSDHLESEEEVGETVDKFIKSFIDRS